ncbi:porin [Vibrio sp.]|nr:porin [Vibrio sp.]
MTAYAEESDSPWSISGFGNITAGYLDTNQANFLGYSNNVSVEPESLVGLQATFTFDNNLSATLQGTLKADEKDNDDILNWAYLTWTPDDNLTFKLGRMRTAFFALSDIIDVGYSYPWITSPQKTYSGWLFPNYDGLDVSWGKNFNQFDATFEGYIGTYKGQIDLSDHYTNIDVDVFGGLIAKLYFNNVEFRVSHHRGEVDVDLTSQIAGVASNLTTAIEQTYLAGGDPSQLIALTNSLNSSANSTKGYVDVDQISLFYDNLNFFSRAEWMKITSSMSFSPRIESYYLSAGYTIFPWTFYATYSHSLVEYNSQIESIRNNALFEPITSYLSDDSVRTWSIGARWDVIPKVALKAEICLIDGYSGKNSFFDSIEDGFDRDATLYKISMEWVF